jgi:pimeloyl-ACP methyl ester carboxylesterase
MRLVRLTFRGLQRVAPDRAAAWAERLFFTPPQTRLSPELTAVLEHAAPFSLMCGGRRVAGWSWGEGEGAPVYLVHGWGSRGGRLAEFVAPLVAAGHRVVTHDAPGHGASDAGLSSMPEFARTLRAIVETMGPAHGVIAHSMGASATALAMTQGLAVPRAVFLAPAANPAAFVRPFAAALALGEDVQRRLRERSELRLSFRWDDLDVPAMARGLAAPLLVFHDRDDRVVPWSDGAAIAAAWPGAELVSTVGLGHRDVVREPEVVARAVGFITGRRGAARADGGGGALAWDARALERDLFDRDARRRRVFAAG